MKRRLFVTVSAAAVFIICAAALVSALVSLKGNAQKPAKGGAAGFLDGVMLPEDKEDEPREDEMFTLRDASTGKIYKVTSKELIIGAVPCEMDLSSPTEALKAQAVACYTLFSRKKLNGEELICSVNDMQVWVSEEKMRERWGEDADKYISMLSDIADSVEGQLLVYDGEPILAAYHAISAGNTESAQNVWGNDVPYLVAVPGAGDAFSDGYLGEKTVSIDEAKRLAEGFFKERKISAKAPEDTEKWLTDINYSPSGYVTSAVLFGKEVTGTELRSVFSLKSASFTVKISENAFVFTTKGWGHGVGMSQAGAIFAAKRGDSFEEILAHYYPGTELISEKISRK